MNLSLSSVFRIIGMVIAVTGLSMLPAFFVSVIYDEMRVFVPLLCISAASLVIGYALFKLCKKSEVQLKIKDGFFIVVLCWFAASILGAVPFIATGSITNFVDAFFESCSGFSTTGASILGDVSSLPRGILFWRSFMSWMGGISILLFAVALMPALGLNGQNITVFEPPGSSLDKVSVKTSDTAKTICALYIAFTVIETVLLSFGDMDLYDALIHAFGTVSTGGFSSYDGSVGHFDSAYVRIVITVFMIVCGTNFNLYCNSLKQGFRTLITDIEFRAYLGIFAISSLFIFFALAATGSSGRTGDALSDSVFQTASILTTTGYTTAGYESWPTICQTILLLLMFVGGCSSSASGGLKVIRIIVVLKLIRRGVSTRLHPNVIETIKLNGNPMPGDIVSSVANHVFLYIVMLFAGSFIISLENIDLMTCFSSVITCLGNIGAGFSMIGPTDSFSGMSVFSKILLSVYMIAGRLEIYALFILLRPRLWNRNY